MDGPRRRKQYSSCDRCRRFRVACDAARRQQHHRLRSCSRCVKAKLDCTFNVSPAVRGTAPGVWSLKDQWIAESPRNLRARESQNAAPDRPPPVPLSTAEPYSPRDDALPAASNSPSWPDAQWVTRALQEIYSQVFDRVFSAWIAHSPGNSEDTSTVSRNNGQISVLELSVDLDEHVGIVPEYQAQSPAQTSSSSADAATINTILVAAMQCFTSRWLPVFDRAFSHAPLSHWHADVVRHLWRAARRHMLKAINKRSYRCILSLLLFGLTPCPSGLEEDEESDGLSGQACIQIALRHIYDLRSRHRTLQFSGSEVVSADASHASPSQREHVSEFLVRAEALLYYAGVIFDTSASLTLNSLPLLTSGILGAGQELIFQLFHSRALLFHDDWAEKRQQHATITDTDAASIIYHAGEWKLYTWKMISVLKEGLRDGYSDEFTLEACRAVFDAIERFQVTHYPLMNACREKLEFLSSMRRLDWYLIILHWHLGILILIDGVEAAGRVDLMAEFEKVRADSEHGALNALKSGTATTFTIRNTGSSAGESTKCSLISIDPYPHHVVVTAQLLSKKILEDHRKGSICDEVFENLRTIILASLGELPSTSSSVQLARNRIQAAFAAASQYPSRLNRREDTAVCQYEFSGIASPQTDLRMAEYMEAVHSAGLSILLTE